MMKVERMSHRKTLHVCSQVGTMRKCSHLVVLEQTTSQLPDKRVTIVYFSVFLRREWWQQQRPRKNDNLETTIQGRILSFHETVVFVFSLGRWNVGVLPFEYPEISWGSSSLVGFSVKLLSELTRICLWQLEVTSSKVFH